MTISDTGGHSNAHEAHGHHGPEVPTYTAASITADVVEKYRSGLPGLRPWLIGTGALLVIGIIGVVLKFTSGAPSQRWGYYVATIAFILSTFQGAPLAAIAVRLAKGDWRRPFTRIAEVFTAVGLLNLLLIIPALMVLPTHQAGQRTIWFGWPGAPYIYVFLAFLMLPAVGLALLLTSSLSDMAAARDSGYLGGGVSRSFGWYGNFKQWRVMRAAITPLGAMYLAMFIFTGLLFGTDFSMSQVPGWVDSIYPAFISIQGLQGGVATLVIALGIMRKTSFRQYITVDQFWGLSKFLLAFSLLWFYFWWSSFIAFWYGKKPAEVALIDLMMTGPYLIPFLLAWFGGFGIPLFTLMWNNVRKSIKGPVIVAVIILIGNFFNQIRLFVAPWSLPTHGGEMVTSMPAFMFPDFADILIVPGLIGGAVFVVLMTARTVPLMSLWEMKEGLLYRVVRRYLRAPRVLVVAKPE